MNRNQRKIVENMKSTKFLYHALMLKYISYTVDMIDPLLLVEVDYEKNSYFN